MTTVILSGILADFAGRSSWCFEVSSVAEALRAINANAPGFLTFLADYQEGQQMYRVRVNEGDIAAIEELAMSRRLDKIELTPVLAGASSSGLWMMVAGAVLAVVGIGIPLLGVALTTAAHTALTLTATLGLAMISGGLAAMSSPKVPETEEKPGNRASYLLSGAVNTVRQGNPVPICYGTVLVGSHVIGASVLSSDTPVLVLWSKTASYVSGSEVVYSGSTWRATQNVPPGNAPAEGSSYWQTI